MGNPFVNLSMQSKTMLKFVELLGLANMSGMMVEIWAIIDKVIDKHKATLDVDNPRDYTDCYLTSLMDESTPKLKHDSWLNCRNSVMDLFMAGSETTSTTLTWAVYFMAKYPEVQVKNPKALVDFFTFTLLTT